MPQTPSTPLHFVTDPDEELRSSVLLSVQKFQAATTLTWLLAHGDIRDLVGRLRYFREGRSEEVAALVKAVVTDAQEHGNTAAVSAALASSVEATQRRSHRPSASPFDFLNALSRDLNQFMKNMNAEIANGNHDAVRAARDLLENRTSALHQSLTETLTPIGKMVDDPDRGKYTVVNEFGYPLRPGPEPQLDRAERDVVNVARKAIYALADDGALQAVLPEPDAPLALKIRELDEDEIEAEISERKQDPENSLDARRSTIINQRRRKALFEWQQAQWPQLDKVVAIASQRGLDAELAALTANEGTVIDDMRDLALRNEAIPQPTATASGNDRVPVSVVADVVAEAGPLTQDINAIPLGTRISRPGRKGGRKALVGAALAALAVVGTGFATAITLALGSATNDPNIAARPPAITIQTPGSETPSAQASPAASRTPDNTAPAVDDDNEDTKKRVIDAVLINGKPTKTPTVAATPSTSATPSPSATGTPTATATPSGTKAPTTEPSTGPTATPTSDAPTIEPTSVPTTAPHTQVPVVPTTEAPEPTKEPTVEPTDDDPTPVVTKTTTQNAEPSQGATEDVELGAEAVPARVENPRVGLAGGAVPVATAVAAFALRSRRRPGSKSVPGSSFMTVINHPPVYSPDPPIEQGTGHHRAGDWGMRIKLGPGYVGTHRMDDARSDASMPAAAEPAMPAPDALATRGLTLRKAAPDLSTEGPLGL